ncbi:MAG: hypothetical protein GF317_19490 [Candidatus Lokiarchaeota archaeon]|nr:hypothetical protein [Candidatus Lokiarchaeota archaeon]MBD3201680.1 hypothetical protein [Candidatus Lokiarchaeota archaeon]
MSDEEYIITILNFKGSRRLNRGVVLYLSYDLYRIVEEVRYNDIAIENEKIMSRISVWIIKEAITENKIGRSIR